VPLSLSLSGRLALVGVCVLAAFFGLTGFVLDRAFRVSAEDAIHEKLQIQVYLLLGAAELDDEGRLFMPEVLPEPRMSSPISGLYASITQGDGRTLWQSLSSVGGNVPYPSTNADRGPVFGLVDDDELYALSYPVTCSVILNLPNPMRVPFTRRDSI
jgi:two-component system sensor histidine kinase PhoQ